MDGVRNQLLARSRFAADEHGGAGARHLRDLLVGLPHGAAGADQIGEVVPLLQLVLEVDVLVEQPLPLFLDDTAGLERLRDHARDDGEEAHRLVVVAAGVELEIDGERAQRRTIQRNRHADVAELLLVALGPPRRAVEHRRLAADARDDDRLAGFDDAAGDALAHAVLH